MQKWVARFFLIVMCCSQTELHQLIKIPVFWQHLQEHRAENPSISLTDFIVLHYFSGDVRDADYDRDMQLPFKSHHSETCYQLSPSLLPTITTVPAATFAQAPTQFHNGYIGTVYTQYCADIWQPPKTAC
jgi:hypothetical protein